ncbi:MAG TPA: hypothetical protein VF202_13250 [Trueperaceae bacterium]
MTAGRSRRGEEAGGADGGTAGATARGPGTVAGGASPTVAESAPGKVNLGLAVLARRGDGFHEIETLFARLDLADEVEATLAPERPGEVSLVVDAAPYPGAPGWFERSVAELPPGEGNLVARAASAYLASWTASVGAPAPGVALRLTKRLPVSAGLGGGSSDAAAALRALERLVPGVPDLGALGLAIGSDVPFFLSGADAAVGRGRGERLTPVAAPRLDLVLAKPELTVSAAEAYGALVGFTGRLRHVAALEALARGAEPAWRNGLQAGVMRAHVEVRELLAELRSLGLRGVLMAGSGPTCFGVAEGPEAAAELAAVLRSRRPDLWVAAARTGPADTEPRAG